MGGSSIRGVSTGGADSGSQAASNAKVHNEARHRRTPQHSPAACYSRVVAEGYEVERVDRFVGWLVGAGVLVLDAALKVVALLGGCGERIRLDGGIAGHVVADPGCGSTELAGPQLALGPFHHRGLVFGLADGSFDGFMGQVVALGYLLLATVVTIVVSRWQYRTGGDSRALGLVWGGAAALAWPRLAGDGSGVAELQAFGLLTGVSSLALVYGLVWLSIRAVAELRA